MSLGIAIVGTGMISQFHARAIGEVRGAKLVACCDRIAERADAFAEEVGCTSYSSMEKMLADPAVDAVSVATPSGAHMEPAVAAAKAGKHVIVEKPLEITLQRCDRIINECEKSGVKLSTFFPSRFHDSSVKMKRAVDEGRFGRLTLGDAYVKWFRTQEYYDSGAWRGTWKLDGGGALMNQAVHTVDLLTWLMGPVAEIQAQTATLAHKRIEVEDVATATLRFENGALGVIEASTAVYPGYLKRIELHGDQGTAVLEEEDLKVWDFTKKTRADAAILKAMQESRSTGGGAADPSAIGHHGHTAQFRDFVSAINNDRAPAIDGHEGRRSVEIVVAIYKAAKSGKTVKLPL
ncbi:Gfo/Idh/MocA family protein [Bythopirellula polymerisocia]|uniref:Glucose--fructose oxidoreductase n=1 Tax=Bythopirellula polymerisocia TaxID=2528003 RepID=A0A5C6CDF7_9BACT|nr:Gfo/Idh/MocA family oxidoreductase [Bythopirellula polymerisocia]TWU20849.1 Glucose--fructose oxidoreductase precursor [Bythopirellula polymerisocia]